MKEYLKRLKDHPGVNYALILTALFFMAAMKNENITIKQAVIVSILASAIPWSMVLITNIKRN